jgi:hypothetical protein
MITATRPPPVSAGGSPGVPPGRGPRRRLWMKFPKRNIYSTSWERRFRRSKAQAVPKFFCFHSFPHRLCTSYARYCTGYPQPLPHAGLVAELLAASVAGYLFFGARCGFQKGGGTVRGGPLQTAGTAKCGKPVDSGDNSGKARIPAGAHDCQTPPVNLDRWWSAACAAQRL